MHESRVRKPTYVLNPQKSLHEIIIHASQIKEGEIDLSGDFEGGRE